MPDCGNQKTKSISYWLSNTATGNNMSLYPWQENILDQVMNGGVKPGQLTIMTSGRAMGKSHFTQQTISRLMDAINSIPISELVLSEGTVYGARYYCVAPVGGIWREMEDWCIDTYGTSTGSIWAESYSKQAPVAGERWYGNNRKFWFRKESDRTLFILRWSR
jgi:hypothetical protein